MRYAFGENGENLYVFGGVADGTRVPDVNRYNATSDTWTPLAPIPVASEAPAGALLNGKYYLVEGDTGDSFNIYDVARTRGRPGLHVRASATTTEPLPERSTARCTSLAEELRR